jgi:phosphopantetheinyl transferase
MLQVRQISDNITIGVLDLKQYAEHAGVGSKRELERAGSTHLLGKLLKGPFELDYLDTGKPVLKNRHEHISISHSHDRLAIIVNSKENTGIDIELVRDKVKAIEHKFLNEEERFMAGSNTRMLICFWAAKETLYKVYGLKQIDFKAHLFIEQYREDEIVAKISAPELQKRYCLACETLGDYQLVYVSHEI